MRYMSLSVKGLAEEGGNQCAIPLRKRVLVSLCEATHWSKASALQTRFEAAAVSCDGLSSVYTEMISWRSEVITPESEY